MSDTVAAAAAPGTRLRLHPTPVSALRPKAAVQPTAKVLWSGSLSQSHMEQLASASTGSIADTRRVLVLHLRGGGRTDAAISRGQPLMEEAEGRAKEMIIIRGANFYCYEIEELITQVHAELPACLRPNLAARMPLSRIR